MTSCETLGKAFHFCEPDWESARIFLPHPAGKTPSISPLYFGTENVFNCADVRMKSERSCRK